MANFTLNEKKCTKDKWKNGELKCKGVKVAAPALQHGILMWPLRIGFCGRKNTLQMLSVLETEKQIFCSKKKYLFVFEQRATSVSCHINIFWFPFIFRANPELAQNEYECRIYKKYSMPQQKTNELSFAKNKYWKNWRNVFLDLIKF